FDQRQVGSERTLREDLAQRSLTQHPGVEIATGPPADVRQVGGIDVVRTDFEGLDRKPAGFEGGNQPGREDGLANVARGTGDHQPWSTYLVQHPCLAIPCSTRCLFPKAPA